MKIIKKIKLSIRNKSICAYDFIASIGAFFVYTKPMCRSPPYFEFENDNQILNNGGFFYAILCEN